MHDCKSKIIQTCGYRPPVNSAALFVRISIRFFWHNSTNWIVNDSENMSERIEIDVLSLEPLGRIRDIEILALLLASK